MNYVVIARKYRPQKFSDITAQDHITQTLKNAVRTGRIAHGYIFSGSRGVGKTTAARILAKALNCEKISTDEKYRTETTEPCGACESCRDFDAGASLNISEFDAASNNGVDDIRQLRENVRYAPQKGRYKVYIIDEFHMLSNAAFNAFLKTLEEPPPHAVFIFATTELHKVPATISSRCQRFNFKRIAATDIAATLSAICKAEKIEIDADSLSLIARKADGAMRDAQSLLDQVISFSTQDGGTSGGIEYARVSELLSAIDEEYFFTVTDAATEQDSKKMIDLTERVFQNGFDISYFLLSLIEHVRNFLLVKNLKSTKLIAASESAKRRYEQGAEHFSPERLMTFIDIISAAERELKTFREPHLKFELTLLKLIHTAASGTADERLSALEKKVDSLFDEVKKKVLTAKP